MDGSLQSEVSALQKARRGRTHPWNDCDREHTPSASGVERTLVKVKSLPAQADVLRRFMSFDSIAGIYVPLVKDGRWANLLFVRRSHERRRRVRYRYRSFEHFSCT